MIRDVLNKLPKKQHRQLMYAFEVGVSQYIELAGKKFVGVNLKGVPNLTTEESAGAWSYGTVRRSN